MLRSTSRFCAAVISIARGIAERVLSSALTTVSKQYLIIMQPQVDPFIAPPCVEQISIVYQDEHLLVINKPSGLLSLSGKHPLNKDSVHWRLVQDFPTATLIHRLDFGTSGLMIVALNKAVNKQLCEQFSQRSVTKYYQAILDGALLINGQQQVGQGGEINIPIIKDADNFPLQKVCQQTGKTAISQYQVISYDAYDAYDASCFLSSELSFNSDSITTKVLFKPLTGRTHQLRIHSREIGHPIIGCDLYDAGQSYFKAPRLMLHASRLIFSHPVSGSEMDVQLAAPF
ncbi:pseudouridine synthase [Reinekea thalattae]|nr:pseudouridine synthase [Reinekea thalattae]